MENVITIGTDYLDFEYGSQNYYQDMYQIHIFSPFYIQSYFYDPQEVSEDYVKSKALEWQSKIKKNTSYDLKISLYNHSGIFLITDGENLINDEELFEFLPDDDKFEYVEGIMNIYEFIGNKQIDEYIKTALKSVDADKIIPHIEPYLQTLRKTQLGAEEQYEEERAKNKMSPKILVEVYNIEKDYKPVKVNEFKISHMSSLFILPEFRDMINGDRVAYKAIEIETGEVIENEINEAIEGIKHEKWMRKHPSVIDLSVLQRMELDNDDPNFISWDDYVANDDEYEEGDDEYSPEF